MNMKLYFCIFHLSLLKFNVANSSHTKDLSFYFIFYLK